MSQQLSFDHLHAAIAGNAATIRVVTHLQPAGGDGTKVFPPTYKHPSRDGATYAVEIRRIGGRKVRTVLLDSVASQANRLEQALLQAFRDEGCDLPLLAVIIPRSGAPATCVTALDAPHRVTDAIFRDSLLDGKRFRESPIGKQLIQARLENATALFHYCPTALIFGFWDSQGEAGVHGAKFARALVSEIIGLGAVPGRGTGSRIDPLAISSSAAKIYKSEADMWTLEEKEAVRDKNKPVLYGKASKAGKPSAVNHGNVTPSVTADEEPGGVTISEAIQTTVLSLAQLRRLRFPDLEDGKTSPDRDIAGRTVLAALALYAVALQHDKGYDLRSRCQLLPLAAPHAEIIGPTAQDITPFILASAACREVLDAARQHARQFGLSWQGGFIELQPSQKLVELVRRSDEKVRAEGGDDAGD
jgi:CRISPR-associated protein Csb1